MSDNSSNNSKDTLFDFTQSKEKVKSYYRDQLKPADVSIGNNVRILIHNCFLYEGFVLPFIELLDEYEKKYEIFILDFVHPNVEAENHDMLKKEISKIMKCSFIDSLKIDDKYDVIFSIFVLHFKKNWRYEFSNLITCLRTGGVFIYPKISGDFEIFDGNFRRRNKLFQDKKDSKKYRALINLMDEYHKDRREYGFYWRPELRSSSYLHLRTELFKLFTSCVRNEKEPYFLGYHHENISFQEITSWVKNKRVAYFKNVDENIFNKVWKKYKDLQNESFDLKKQFNINISKGFKNDYFNEQFFWTSDSYLYKLQDINNSDFNTLGRKVMDLLLTHDTFIPEITKSMLILGWDEDLNERLEPTFIATDSTLITANSSSKDNNKFAEYLHLKNINSFINQEEDKLTVNALIVSNLKHKCSLYFARKPNNIYSEGEELKIQYKVGANDYEIAIQVEYNDQGDVQSLMINIPKNSIDKVYKLDSSININLLSMDDELPVKLESRGLEYLKLENNDAIDIASSFLLKSSDIVIGDDYGFLEKCLLTDKDEDNITLRKFVLGCLIINQCFNLNENLFGIFPSGVIETKDPKIGVKGIGGIFILEKIFEPDEISRSVDSIIKIRNRTVAKACNILFYKTSIASQIDKDFVEKSLMAGVSGVIARNGSHGLGSHVLPRAAHVSQNPTDNKLLFNYIEQRLDFIAQVTSEFPIWSFPTQFNSDLMMRFYLQRNILNNLVKSEGVSAYEFEMNDTEEFNWEGENISEKERITIRGFLIKNSKRTLTISKNHPDIKDDKLVLCRFNSDLPEGIEKQMKRPFRIIGRMSDQSEREVEDCELLEHKLIIKVRKRSFLQFSTSLDAKDEAPIVRGDLFKIRQQPYSEYRKDKNTVDAGEKTESFYADKKSETINIYGVIIDFDLKQNVIVLLSYYNKGRFTCRFNKKEFGRYDQVLSYLTYGRRCLIRGKIENEDDTFILNNCKMLELVWIQHLVTAKMDSNPDDKLDLDIAVAIPGGVIGYQAYYTILENIIRNTAKHTWTKLTPIEKIGQNIEIKIEIEEIKNADFLICRIWSTIGDLRINDLPDYEILRKDQLNENFLHRKLNKFFNKKLVGAQGRIIKEHLGMSEMKISAGYLSNQSLKNIGGYEGNNILLGHYANEEKGFIKATSIWEAHGKDLVPRLGYKFKMNKPKDLVIISNDENDYNDVDRGIYLEKPQDIIEKELNLDYGFCVIKPETFEDEDCSSIFCLLKRIAKGEKLDKITEFAIILEEMQYLPFRSFVVTGDTDFSAIVGNLKDGMRFITARMVFIKQEEYDSFCFPEGKDGYHESELLILNLYDRWLHHIQIEKGSYSLEVNLGMLSNFKKDLYVERSSIESTARLFNKFIIKDFIEEIQRSDIKITDKEHVLLLNFKEEERQHSTSIYGFLYSWLSHAFDSVERFTQMYPIFLSVFQEYFKHHEKLFEKNISVLETLPPIFRPDTKKRLDHKLESLSSDYNYVYRSENNNSIHKILGAEKLENKVFDKEGSIKSNDQIEGQEKLSEGLNEKVKKIAYIRHSLNEKEDYFYKDYISGSQIFYSILKENPDPAINIFGFNILIRQLYENAYPKIMIVDERVNEFVSQSNYRKRLSNVNIIIPKTVKFYENIDNNGVWEERITIVYGDKDDKNPKIEQEINGKRLCLYFDDCENTGAIRESGPYKYNIHVFVIHNTILENNYESDDLDRFIIEMQATHIPCFLVTSGKGKPGNMSKYTKFLPFSNVENFILQSHPEKFLFTQILFRIINNRSRK